jgi:hypothetical protein
MKSRLNLTIDDSLLKRTKLYAERQRMSVSELVADYFKSLQRPVQRKTFIDMVENLDKPNIDPKADLRELYYKDQKHGG